MVSATDPHPCFFYGSLMEPKVLNSVTRPGPEANLFAVRASIEVKKIMANQMQKPDVDTLFVCRHDETGTVITVPLETQYIKGFIRYPYHDEPYPGMIVSTEKSHTVEGLLVFGHTMMDRFRLDQFEGSEYTREILQVKVFDPVPGAYNVQGQSMPLAAGDLVSAYVYVFTGPHEHLDRTKEWDFDAFQREHVTIWMQTSSDFA